MSANKYRHNTRHHHHHHHHYHRRHTRPKVSVGVAIKHHHHHHRSLSIVCGALQKKKIGEMCNWKIMDYVNLNAYRLGGDKPCPKLLLNINEHTGKLMLTIVRLTTPSHMKQLPSIISPLTVSNKFNSSLFGKEANHRIPLVEKKTFNVNGGEDV